MQTEIRPRFKVIVPQSEATVMQHFKESLQALDKNELTGKVLGRHVTIQFPQKDQTFWTPEVNINVDTFEEGTEIRGLAGPKSSVWLMFVFFYSLLGVASIFLLMYGMTQKQLGIASSILWLIPILLLIILGMFLGAKLGQKLSKDQLHFIKKYVRSVLKTLKDKPHANKNDKN